MEMIDDTYKKLRLRAKENTVNMNKGTCSMATSLAWKATSLGPEATSESVMATITPVQATTQSPASTTVPPSSPMLPKQVAKRTATPAASPLVTTSASEKATPSPSISTKLHISAAAKRANIQASQAKATIMLPTSSLVHQNTPQGRSDGGHSSDKKIEEAVILDVTPVGKEGNTSSGNSMPMNSPQFDSTPVEKK
jgi:hypothetical protein